MRRQPHRITRPGRNVPRCRARSHAGYVETIGVPELLIVLAVVLLLFGSKKLPELARSLGQAAKEFRKRTRNGAGDDHGGGA